MIQLEQIILAVVVLEMAAAAMVAVPVLVTLTPEVAERLFV
jgi:hypothetical protein